MKATKTIKDEVVAGQYHALVQMENSAAKLVVEMALEAFASSLEEVQKLERALKAGDYTTIAKAAAAAQAAQDAEGGGDNDAEPEAS